MKSIKEIEHLQGVKVLLRLDLNVPIQNGRIMDDYRIRKSEETLNYLREKGAKTIIIAHIEGEGEKTLKLVADYLSKNYLVQFVPNFKNAFKESELLDEGAFLMLENIRENEGEKKNDEKFAKELATLGDVYINEAFSVSHRDHASVSAITKFLPSYAGFQFAREVEHLSKSFNPPRPFIFILGGAKFETKLPLIEKFMKLADYVFVGGALANNFFKEKGMEVGISVVSEENFKLDRYFENPKLLLPVDIENQNNEIKKVAEVTKEDKMLDVGTETLSQLKEVISKCKFVLWNGPLGNYEAGYKKPTLDLAKIIAESGVESAVGGGDTLAAIAELGIEEKFTFVSTGGGAMLDYLANETLPGIEALEKSK
jgi:phosphoglycerate kinase